MALMSETGMMNDGTETEGEDAQLTLHA